MVKVEYREDPFELRIKKNTLSISMIKITQIFSCKKHWFAGTGSIQHHYVSLFVSERLMENYSSEHKYKQCYLVSERMRNLNESRRIYLKF